MAPPMSRQDIPEGNPKPSEAFPIAAVAIMFLLALVFALATA